MGGLFDSRMGVLESGLICPGSLKSDFIAPDIAQELIKNGATMRKVVGGHRCQVCTTDGCTLVNTIVTFNLVFLNEVTIQMTI